MFKMHRIKTCSLILIFIGAFGSLKAAVTLSPAAEISLLTCASGPDLYKAFGHSAVRVRDPEHGFDRVYNYGTFDFSTENFYIKFARGQLNYWLNVSRFQNFMAEYIYFDQTVYEDLFNFTQEEKQAVFDFLENNYLPENRFYLYDFFRDNCSTRIRDIVYDVFPERIQISDSSWYTPRTFREGIDQYINDRYLWHLGMDLGLGLPSDQTMTINDYMFLPEYLMKGLRSMTMTAAGTEKPLIKSTRILHDGVPFASGTMGLNYVLIILLLIAASVMVFTYRELNAGMESRKADNVIYGFCAFLAVVMLLLWFGTDHYTTAINPDLLWTLPPVLVLVFRKKIRNGSRAGNIILKGSLLSVGLYFALWIFFDINENMMILPLTGIVLVRLIKNLLDFKPGSESKQTA